jgi:hypothetical protein
LALRRPTSRYAPPPTPATDPADYEVINIRRINFTLDGDIPLSFALEKDNPKHGFHHNEEKTMYIILIDDHRTEIPISRILYSESFPDTIRRPYKPKPE